jgi:hypothetical protein
VLKPGGVLVFAVARPDQDKAARYHIRAVFFLVVVTTALLAMIAGLLDAGQLAAKVGEVLTPHRSAHGTRDAGVETPQAGQDRTGNRCLSMTSYGHDPWGINRARSVNEKHTFVSGMKVHSRSIIELKKELESYTVPAAYFELL